MKKKTTDKSLNIIAPENVIELRTGVKKAKVKMPFTRALDAQKYGRVFYIEEEPYVVVDVMPGYAVLESKECCEGDDEE